MKLFFAQAATQASILLKAFVRLSTNVCNMLLIQEVIHSIRVGVRALATITSRDQNPALFATIHAQLVPAQVLLGVLLAGLAQQLQVVFVPSILLSIHREVTYSDQFRVCQQV